MSILCADIGTSSLKTALVNLQGQVLCEARISFPKTEFNQEGLCASDLATIPVVCQSSFLETTGFLHCRRQVTSYNSNNQKNRLKEFVFLGTVPHWQLLLVKFFCGIIL